MKFKHLLTATAMMLSISVVAQPKTDAKENKEEGFKFETIKELPVTSVKNQNQALGVTGHEPLDCILPDDCSDKALLEYPGFDKIWAKHCEDLDWYPKFD